MTQTAPLPHISNYQVVIESEKIGLGAKEELAIHNGWQHHGSLAVNHTSDGAIYAQPMVKYGVVAWTPGPLISDAFRSSRML